MLKRIFPFLLLFSAFLHLEDTNSWVIDDIRLTGLQRISAGSVFAVMPVGLGDEINKEMFKEIALSIFNTGKFIIDTDNEVTNSATGETYRQLMYAERQRQRRFASIVLNYNFGKQQKKKWSRGSFSGRSGGMGGGMDMDY